ncbi:MAG: SpoIID/LytB domain-containing protein [Cyanobacteriota bacterium]
MLKLYHFIILVVISFLFFCQTAISNQEYQEQLIRVGISSSDFNDLEYSSTTLTADSAFSITDLSLEKTLVNASPGAVYKITVDSNGFNIYSSSKLLLSKINGPVGVFSPGGHVRLLDIKRKGQVPAYRGKFEIVRAASSPAKLSVVNVLPLDEYLKGVVPNELPVSFGFEALKAQAVAARNYAVRPREKPYDQFDICDSVMCQVYFGYYTENTLSNKAVEETAGLVALYRGDVITALYSSAPGGFTENYEFAFSDPKTKEFPCGSKPYLKGKCDIPGFDDLSDEESARKFYTSLPATHDVKSGYYRWDRYWTKSELEKEINMSLAKLSNTKESEPFVNPAFSKTSNIGTLMDLKVLKRGVSGKAIDLKITGSNGSWVVQKELNIRRLLTKNGKALPSANIIINRATDPNGNLVGIKIVGGGFGHGVGMSQYGASSMSSKGYKFDQILQHYYTGVALGTIPVFMYQQDFVVEPIKQVFYAPQGRGNLWIDSEGVSPIRLKINGKDLVLKDPPGYCVKKNIDISSYLKTGANEVIYMPPDSHMNEGMSVKLWIEVVKAKN